MLDRLKRTRQRGHPLDILDASEQEFEELDNSTELEAVVGRGVTSVIREHPVASVGAALGIGGVVGFGGGFGLGKAVGQAQSGSSVDIDVDKKKKKH